MEFYLTNDLNYDAIF